MATKFNWQSKRENEYEGMAMKKDKFQAMNKVGYIHDFAPVDAIMMEKKRPLRLPLPEPDCGEGQAS